ncbi:MAG: hypothetical protein CM15mP75_5240 [Flammeovirgaceae bacterium]|nr:MAG: hypothetical protein CM15mP75_5240 [Flammeovirgaceae bacterium]
MNERTFISKNKINVLLLEKVDKVAFDLFKEEGYNVESLMVASTRKILSKKLKTYQY